MAGNLQKSLPELIKAGILSSEKAEEIRQYYSQQKSSSTNRLIIVFAILGAILVGLGIILIIAHNWDELSRSTKTVFAFLPMVIGQLIAGFVILRKRQSIAWREGASVFLVFAVGASISLVSQIYHIPGSISSFLLTWMVLCMPLIYLMNSSITSLMVIIGATYYACDLVYWSGQHDTSVGYWLLMAAVFPHYYKLFRNKPYGNFMLLHNWFISLSFTICLGTIATENDYFMFMAYLNLFGLFHIVGNSRLLSDWSVVRNAYRALGSVGTIVILLILSFDWFWKDLAKENELLYYSNGLFAAALLAVGALLVSVINFRKGSWKSIQAVDCVFLFFIPVFIVGTYHVYSTVVLINLIVLAVGLAIVRKGTRENHFGILNYGLLIVTALVICRFFDSNISFIVRGLLFVIVGAGFFAANYLMIKKRKSR